MAEAEMVHPLALFQTNKSFKQLQKLVTLKLHQTQEHRQMIPALHFSGEHKTTKKTAFQCENKKAMHVVLNVLKNALNRWEMNVRKKHLCDMKAK